MDPNDVDEMRSSFSTIFARKAELAERFYSHLFVHLPEVEELFGDDFSKQKEMFASMLTYCLKGVANSQSMPHAQAGLIKIHARFNLGSREMELAGKAVMAALEDVLGNDLSPKQRAVWEQAISGVMQLLLTETEAELAAQS
ncbi:MAG: hypothetical protein BM558_11495 [Roseobacter sp. MedPE-SW]|nr:MAG: hypothetical protein BM558_11495 [Roseobacter sp. MedPE-SW]